MKAFFSRFAALSLLLLCVSQMGVAAEPAVVQSEVYATYYQYIPPLWIDSKTVAFIGNRNPHSVMDLSICDSLFVWKLDTPPKEILPGVVCSDRIPAMFAVSGSGFLSLTEGGQQSDPKIVDSGHYYKFNDQSVNRVDAKTYLSFKSHDAEIAVENRKLETSAKELVGQSSVGASVYLSPDRNQAVVFRDPTYFRRTREQNIASWSKDNCWPFYAVDFSTQKVSRRCLPYSGAQNAILKPLLVAGEAFFIATAFNYESWQPDIFGIYRINGNALTRTFEHDFFLKWAVSPDGCKVALVRGSSDHLDVNPKNATITIWNACEGH